MRATVRQLNIFASVARNLSFTRAADELHLSQPAVSMQVKQLEDEAGLPLFEKTGKKIQLTEAGQEMYNYALSIKQQFREIGDIMSALKGVQRGHLAISVATTANSFATAILAAFTREFPQVTFSLDITNRKSLLDQLMHNETDLVIMGQPPADLGLVSKAFMDNPLVIIAAPDHPLANNTSVIPWSQLKDETFVVREKVSGTRIAMERYFNSKDIKLKTAMETTSNSAIKHAVSANLGLGLVSLHTLELELLLNRLAILNVEDFPIKRQWHVVHTKSKRLSPVAKAFLQFLDSDKAKPLLQFNYPTFKA